MNSAYRVIAGWHGMGTMKLTTCSVETAKSDGKEVVLWDTNLRGFGLKVTKAGTKTYVIPYRMGGRGSPTRWATIGRPSVDMVVHGRSRLRGAKLSKSLGNRRGH